MVALYPYQQDYITALRTSIKQGNKRIILCAPTGSGKTVMFSFMVSEHINKGGNAIIFTHRKELLKQASSTFDSPELITSGKISNRSARIHVAMVESVYRNISDFKMLLAQKTLIIIDEAHLNNFNKLFPFFSDASIVIGATATPFKKPKEIQMDEFYTDMVQCVDTPDVIQMGKLSPARTYGIELDLSGLKKNATDYDTEDFYTKNKTYKGVVANWVKNSLHRKTIVFASSVKSSKEICEEFNKNGFKAMHIDGTTPEKIRDERLEWFKNEPEAILCNCGILTAGFDQADILTVILYRATTSLPLFLQMCGRGSRIAHNKQYFTIMDFGNNIARHGFWEDGREWRLNYRDKAPKLNAAPVKICKKCDAINRASAKVCVICSAAFPIPKPTEEEVVLVELKKLESKMLSECTADELAVLQKSKRFSAPLIWRVVRSKGTPEIVKFSKIMNYSSGWIKRQIDEKSYEFTDRKI